MISLAIYRLVTRSGRTGQRYPASGYDQVAQVTSVHCELFLSVAYSAEATCGSIERSLPDSRHYADLDSSSACSDDMANTAPREIWFQIASYLTTAEIKRLAPAHRALAALASQSWAKERATLVLNITSEYHGTGITHADWSNSAHKLMAQMLRYTLV